MKHFFTVKLCYYKIMISQVEESTAWPSLPPSEQNRLKTVDMSAYRRCVRRVKTNAIILLIISALLLPSILHEDNIYKALLSCAIGALLIATGVLILIRKRIGFILFRIVAVITIVLLSIVLLRSLYELFFILSGGEIAQMVQGWSTSGGAPGVLLAIGIVLPIMGLAIGALIIAFSVWYATSAYFYFRRKDVQDMYFRDSTETLLLS
ncbi:hypothetical protein D3C86_823970 [compost metagenome]